MQKTSFALNVIQRAAFIKWVFKKRNHNWVPITSVCFEREDTIHGAYCAWLSNKAWICMQPTCRSAFSCCRFLVNQESRCPLNGKLAAHKSNFKIGWSHVMTLHAQLNWIGSRWCACCFYADAWQRSKPRGILFISPPQNESSLACKNFIG